MKKTTELFSFIKKSPTAFHTVKAVADRLIKDGYTRLYENDEWKLQPNGKYFVIRGGASIIAFRTVEKALGFTAVATHSDSPCFALKENFQKSGAYSRLIVEGYGGMINYSWLDRPLSVAGRVIVKTADGMRETLVDLDKNLLTIPSVAIHFNRTVNEGLKLNPAVDMLPLYSTSGNADLKGEIAKSLGVKDEEILGFDLFVYNRDEGSIFGANGELMLCPRLDNLECAFSALEAFLTAKNSSETVPVLAIFDNEEVGSQSSHGAGSTFLEDVLYRVAGDREKYLRMLANGFIVSADNAHALHPNHPELSDGDNAPVLNGGVVIKKTASRRYATDGASYALMEEICRRAGVKTQVFHNRADLPGGSTLGAITDGKVSVPTVDIGFAQLAMHSANETAGSLDLIEMIKALTELYSTKIDRHAEIWKF